MTTNESSIFLPPIGQEVEIYSEVIDGFICGSVCRYNKNIATISLGPQLPKKTIDFTASSYKLVYNAGELSVDVESIVGYNVDIMQRDGKFKKGNVRQADKEMNCNFVRYDDGFKEWVDLSRCNVRLYMTPSDCEVYEEEPADTTTTVYSTSSSDVKPPVEMNDASWYSYGYTIELIDSSFQIIEEAVSLSIEQNILTVYNKVRGNFEVDVEEQDHKIVVDGIQFEGSSLIAKFLEVTMPSGIMAYGIVIEVVSNLSKICLLSGEIEEVDLQNVVFKIIITSNLEAFHEYHLNNKLDNCKVGYSELTSVDQEDSIDWSIQPNNLIERKIHSPKPILPISNFSTALNQNKILLEPISLKPVKTTESLTTTNNLQLCRKANVDIICDETSVEIQSWMCNLQTNQAIEVFDHDICKYVKGEISFSDQALRQGYYLVKQKCGSVQELIFPETVCKIPLDQFTLSNTFSVDEELLGQRVDLYDKLKKSVIPGIIHDIDKENSTICIYFRNGSQDWVSVQSSKVKLRWGKSRQKTPAKKSPKSVCDISFVDNKDSMASEVTDLDHLNIQKTVDHNTTADCSEHVKSKSLWACSFSNGTLLDESNSQHFGNEILLNEFSEDSQLHFASEVPSHEEIDGFMSDTDNISQPKGVSGMNSKCKSSMSINSLVTKKESNQFIKAKSSYSLYKECGEEILSDISIAKTVAHNDIIWYEYVDIDSNNKYWVDCRTGLSQWNPPKWIDVVDYTSGATYYLNNETGESQWEIPAEFERILSSSQHHEISENGKMPGVSNQSNTSSAPVGAVQAIRQNRRWLSKKSLL